MARKLDPMPLMIIKDIFYKASTQKSFRKGEAFEEGELTYNLSWSGETGPYRGEARQLDVMGAFLEEELIGPITITIHEYLEESDQMELTQTLLWKSKAQTRTMREQVLGAMLAAENLEFVEVFYSFKPHLDKINDYIQAYLKDWKQGNFYLWKKNVCHPPKQLELTTNQILELLEHYPPTHLYIQEPQKEEVDFLATMLFLEQEGFLSLEGFEGFIYKAQDKEDESNPFNLRETGLAIRASIHKSFIKTFTRKGADKTYYHFLINKASLLEQKLIFANPRTLYHKQSSHEMNRDCIPFHFMHLAMDYEGTVKVDQLKEASGEVDNDKIKKALGNFKRTLRSKFHLSEEDYLFNKEGDKWVLDEDKFYFLPKKAKISL